MKLPTLQQLKPIASGFVFGAAIGMWVGFYGVQARLSYHDMLNTFGTNFFLSDQAKTQYCNADYDSARASLLNWLRYLDKPGPDLTQAEKDLMTPQSVAGDKTIVFGQLALLEERHGDPAQAKNYWKQAENAAKAAQWKDYSDERIRALVDDPKYCKASEAITRPKAESPKP
jgi:hypothetical protein